MGLTEDRPRGKFLSIIQGKLRMKTESTNPKAVAREWEKDGKKGVKHELVFIDVSGLITDVSFTQTDFGEQLSITVKDGENNFIINTAADSRYAMNFMRRFPAIDLNKKIVLMPYDVEDNGKQNTGIKITQGGEVIPDQYWDSEKKKAKSGIPQMLEDSPDSGDWKIHFIKVYKFLKAQVISKVENFSFENQKHSNVIDSKNESDFSDVEISEKDNDPPF